MSPSLISKYGISIDRHRNKRLVKQGRKTQKRNDQFLNCISNYNHKTAQKLKKLAADSFQKRHTKMKKPYKTIPYKQSNRPKRSKKSTRTPTTPRTQRNCNKNKECTTGSATTTTLNTRTVHTRKEDESTVVTTTLTMSSNKKEESELTPAMIGVVVLAVCLFLVLFVIVIKKTTTFLKKKKRKISSQQNDILAENLYAEIDESRLDEHLPEQTPYVHPVNDTGEYSHLSEPSISKQKPGGGEVSFMTDSSGYSHVIMKNEKSKLDQPEAALPKSTDTYAIPYGHSITKENTDSDVHVTFGKEEQNVYNVIENSG